MEEVSEGMAATGDCWSKDARDLEGREMTRTLTKILLVVALCVEALLLFKQTEAAWAFICFYWLITVIKLKLEDRK